MTNKTIINRNAAVFFVNKETVNLCARLHMCLFVTEVMESLDSHTTKIIINSLFLVIVSGLFSWKEYQ